MIRFSHTICYVKDVLKSLDFYKNAFGLQAKFLHESNQYAELDTGQTTLAFASEELAKLNFPEGYISNESTRPLACEIVFSTSDVHSVYEKALKNGAMNSAAPKKKPWGQTVAFVRDPNGVLIEIAEELEE
jgi:lactoylglutathione lyase